MIAIPIEKADKIILDFKDDIDSYKTEILDKLVSFRVTLADSQLAYVDLLIEFIRDLDGLRAKKKIISQKKAEFDNIYNKANTSLKEWKSFKDSLIYRLGYSDRRGDFYPKYFKKIGIKSCVFCNSQLCVTVSSKKNELIAKFQVDHYLNKSEYPCFSVSLFNLYPVCASCNLKKGIHKIDFDLYVDSKDIKKSNYSFQLEDIDASVAKYLLDRKSENLSIKFIEPTPPIGHKSFNEVFSIEGIYETQKDLAEELILKAEIYTKSYKETLVKSFKEIFSNTNITNRIIIGNYAEENEIHNRPMAKFTQDIAKQLGLLD